MRNCLFLVYSLSLDLYNAFKTKKWRQARGLKLQKPCKSLEETLRKPKIPKNSGRKIFSKHSNFFHDFGGIPPIKLHSILNIERSFPANLVMRSSQDLAHKLVLLPWCHDKKVWVHCQQKWLFISQIFPSLPL